MAVRGVHGLDAKHCEHFAHVLDAALETCDELPSASLSRTEFFSFYGLRHEWGHAVALWGGRTDEADHHR